MPVDINRDVSYIWRNFGLNSEVCTGIQIHQFQMIGQPWLKFDILIENT